ncbi:unnamed protein product, partial [Sphagnum balticum]
MKEDVEVEIESAREAWRRVVGEGKEEIWVAEKEKEKEDEDETDGILCRLVEGLGTTYSEEDHGDALREKATKGKDVIVDAEEKSMGWKLREREFVEWYLEYLFGERSDDEDNDENNNDKSDMANKNAVSDVSGSKDMWTGTKWSIHPSGGGSAVDERWKCEECYVSNDKSTNVCAACGSKGPNKTEELGSSEGEKAVSTSSISGSGFIFGSGGVSERASISGSGFIFGSGGTPSVGSSFTLPLSSSVPTSSLFSFTTKSSNDITTSSSSVRVAEYGKVKLAEEYV